MSDEQIFELINKPQIHLDDTVQEYQKSVQAFSDNLTTLMESVKDLGYNSNSEFDVKYFIDNNFTEEDYENLYYILDNPNYQLFTNIKTKLGLINERELEEYNNRYKTLVDNSITIKFQARGDYELFYNSMKMFEKLYKNNDTERKLLNASLKLVDFFDALSNENIERIVFISEEEGKELEVQVSPDQKFATDGRIGKMKFNRRITSNPESLTTNVTISNPSYIIIKDEPSARNYNRCTNKSVAYIIGHDVNTKKIITDENGKNKIFGEKLNKVNKELQYLNSLNKLDLAVERTQMYYDEHIKLEVEKYLIPLIKELKLKDSLGLEDTKDKNLTRALANMIVNNELDQISTVTRDLINKKTTKNSDKPKQKTIGELK